MTRVRLLPTSRFWMLTGLLALFAFGGDIVADTMADLRGDHCLSESSQSDSHHEKSPCSHCSCAVHNGSVLAGSAAEGLTGDLRLAGFALTTDQFSPPGIPADIDHPPQLS